MTTMTMMTTMMRLRTIAAASVLPLSCAMMSCSSTTERETSHASDLLGSNGATTAPLPAVVSEVVSNSAKHKPIRATMPSSSSPPRGVPIFEPGDDEIAFYEVELAPAGYAIVTARDPVRVIEISDVGIGPASRLAHAPGGRVLRLDTALYVSVDASGKSIAQSSRSIARIDRQRGRSSAKLVHQTADEAIASFASARADLIRAMASTRPGTGPIRTQGWFDWFGSSPPERTCDIAGEVPQYVQIAASDPPNDTSCFSGCGPTAWAMIFGWASQRAAANGGDQPFANLFRDGSNADGSPFVAPSTHDGNVKTLTWSLRNDLSTFCLTDQGATTPWSMDGNTKSWVAARAPGVVVDVDYSTLMLEDSGVRDEAVDAICDGRPSILGIGSMFTTDMHYPVAAHYDTGWFWLEMGWGGGGNAWYQTGTWFMGSVRH